MSSNKFRFSVSIESNPKEIYNSKERRECQRIKGRIKNAQFNSSFERKGRKELSNFWRNNSSPSLPSIQLSLIY
jgi:hypothetical protein